MSEPGTGSPPFVDEERVRLTLTGDAARREVLGRGRWPRPCGCRSGATQRSVHVFEGAYELDRSADGGYTARISARGTAVLASPMINRGTAFTLAERQRAGADRAAADRACRRWTGSCGGCYAQYCRAGQRPGEVGVSGQPAQTATRCCSTGCSAEHIEEMLPIVYTPTVGLAIERFSHEFRRPRGVYLSVDHPEDVETALRNTGLGRRRRRPAGGDRLRGHPRDRRPGRRRHRDRHRQARRLHRRRRHPPVAGAPGRAGRGHRQPGAAQRPAVPGRAARPGPRPALRRVHRRLRHRGQHSCSRTRCCTGRTSAPPTPAAS